VLAWCRRGPPLAQVRALDVTAAPPDAALASFVRRPTA
jgi:hypothetical protein